MRIMKLMESNNADLKQDWRKKNENSEPPAKKAEPVASKKETPVNPGFLFMLVEIDFSCLLRTRKIIGVN